MSNWEIYIDQLPQEKINEVCACFRGRMPDAETAKRTGLDYRIVVTLHQRFKNLCTVFGAFKTPEEQKAAAQSIWKTSQAPHADRPISRY